MMSRFTDIISDQQGRYQWGVRDCLTTASAFVEESSGKPLNLNAWRLQTEARAVAKAKRIYAGAVETGHRNVLKQYGYRPLGSETPIRPGDILSLAAPVEFPEGIAHVDHGVATLGFVADTYEIYTWSQHGLRPCLATIIEVHRCHKP